jgi:RNA polymerase sigma-70 factor (ECF subfamily)
LYCLPHTDDADRTQAGDAFERLRPRLTAIGRRIVGSAADAEDVVQDCFVKWLAADRAALDTPAAWLTTVVRHGAIDRLRARARDDEALAAMALDAANDGAGHGANDSGAPSPEDALLRRADLAEGLARLLARLSPAERMALVLHDALDCAHADIAVLLGILPATARQHVSRARRRLRESASAALAEHEEKRCRERVRRFQAAINGMGVPALAALLADEQPVSVLAAAPSASHPLVDAVGTSARACANEACYVLAA